MKRLTDQQNIALKIKAGDEKAFEHIFRRYYAGMCGYGVKYLQNIDVAEEIVQEIFLNYWEKRTTLEINGSVEAYLFRAVRNTCLNRLKHLKVTKQYVAEQINLLKGKEGREVDKMIELELSQKIDECINMLPAKRKRIFKLSREEGYKYKEIADQLSLSVKTVEAQMGKALKFLRENLTEYLPMWIALLCVKLLWMVKIF